MAMRRLSQRMVRSVFLVGVATPATTGGCFASPDSSGGDPLAQRRQAVLNATRDEALSYPFVGFVSGSTSTQGKDGWCSGVRLSCGAVLTAAHCVSGGIDTGNGAFYARYYAGECGFSSDGDSSGFSGAVVAPGFVPSLNGPMSDQQIAHDLAILPLERPGTAEGRRLARSLPHARLADIGVSVIGAGPLTEVGYGPVSRTDTGVCKEDENCGSGGVIKHGAYRKYAEMLPVQVGGVWGALALQGVGGTMAAPGDSGGPLLLGADMVVGIQSSTNGSDGAECNATMAFAANVTHPEPGQWIREQLALLDRDGDGTPDACDDCPDISDDGYDADGDGVGDACDDCPCSPSESFPWSVDKSPGDSSSDGDGRCAKCLTGLPSDTEGRCAALCPGFPLDTCPNVVNDDAQNCNLQAELAMEARILGDACDPVPCPRFDSQEKSSAVVQAVPMGGASKGFIGTLYISESSTGKLAITPLGAHLSPEKVKTWAAGGVISDPSKVLEAEVEVGSTEYRYCVDIAQIGVDCSDLPHIRDDKLRQDDGRVYEYEGSVWHRIWIVGPEIPKPSSSSDSLNPLDLELNPYGPDTVAERTWQWEDDFTYWSTTSWASFLPYGVPSEPGQGKGRLWVHANTTHGMSGNSTDALQGVHGKASDPTVPQSGLANAFQDVSPLSLTSRYVVQKLLTRLPLKLDMTVRPCLACGITVPEPGAVEHPDWGYPLVQVPGGSPREAQQIVTFAGIGTPAVLLRDGSLVDLAGRLGPGLQASLALGVRFVDAAEADPAAGKGALAPSAIGLAGTGNSIAERLYVQSGMLLGQHDVSPTHGVHALLASAEGTGPTVAPEPRTDPVTVYSRSSRRLFLLGGQSKASGDPLRDVWFADVDTSAWTRVPLKAFSLGSVVAATYSPRDGKLWVLDELSVGRRAQARRLLRIQPGTGVVEVLGQWLKLGVFDQHWLVLDRDASVLFVASSDKLKKHVVLHFKPETSGLHVDRVYAGKHALALPPLVDSVGYAFTTLSAKDKMPTVVRVQELSGGLLAHWGDPGGCL